MPDPGGDAVEEPAIGAEPPAANGENEARGGTRARQPPSAPLSAAIPPQGSGPAPDMAGELTVVDRYYQAWTVYRREHGREPRDSELSQFLAEQGIVGRSGAPVKPSTLRRYLPNSGSTPCGLCNAKNTPDRERTAWSRNSPSLASQPSTGSRSRPLRGEVPARLRTPLENLLRSLVQRTCLIRPSQRRGP